MDQEQPLHNEEPLSQLSKQELVKIILTSAKNNYGTTNQNRKADSE